MGACNHIAASHTGLVGAAEERLAQIFEEV